MPVSYYGIWNHEGIPYYAFRPNPDSTTYSESVALASNTLSYGTGDLSMLPKSTVAEPQTT
jgi:hypothetical protein